MTTTVYLVGEPGAGKSTLMAELRAGWPEVSREKRPLRHVLWEAPSGQLVPELGWADGPFPGTDTLPMDAVVAAEAWIATCDYPLVLGEGDRLACSRFFDAAEAAGQLVLVYVAVPAALGAERRAERGGGQADSWVAGRRTKVANLLRAYPHHVTVDTEYPSDVLARHLRLAVPELAEVAA